MRITETLQDLFEKHQAFWIQDLILSYQGHPLVRNDKMLNGIQFWLLEVSADNTAVMRLLRDTDDEVLHQNIPYTDYPEGKHKFRLCDREVMMLPEDY